VQLASSNERADAMFRSVINLGAALRVPVLVEGVETLDQDALITATGCEEVQGYFYGRPIPYEDATAMLKTMRVSGAKDPMSQWQGLYAGLKQEREARSA
jgi:EAL domain-containing protein (putative c-di-GMP-specific phosphodiesterase class I)